MSNDIVFNAHGNTIKLQLLTAGVAFDLSAVTKIIAVFGDTDIVSTDSAAGDIRWSQAGFETGEIQLVLGDVGLTPDIYPEVWIVVYSPNLEDGNEVWDDISITVKAEVLNTP